MILLAIGVLLAFTALLMWAFERDNNEWRLEPDDDYVISTLWRTRR